MNHNTLYKSILKSMTGRYAVYGSNALSTVVLARLFSPTDFGIVASIMVFYVFFQMMAEAGLGPAIVNIDYLENEDRDGIFSLTVISGFLLGLIFLLMGPVLSDFYHMEGITIVVPYVALSIFLFSCSILPTAFLLRGQNFYSIGTAGVFAELLSLVITIVLLKFVSPLHALSSKGLFSALINFLMLYYFADKTSFKRPYFGRKFHAIKPMLSFSSYQFGFNLLNYFSRNLDNVLVGKYFGATSLGIYEKAYKLMKYPLMLLTFAMTPAIQPELRKHAKDLDYVEKLHRDFTIKLCMLAGIAGMISFIFSGEIVRILLGSQWSEVIPVFKIFSVCIPVQVVLSTSGSFFQALNRPKLLFLAGVLSAIFMVGAIIYGIQKESMVDLSWALVAAFHINFIIVYTILYGFVFKRNMIKFFLPMFSILSLLLIYFIKNF